MITLPTISLVTPSYNQAAYIERTIESVLSQNYPELDWWIMDAMSDDGTGEILDRYRDVPGLTIVREPDTGQTNAINKALRAARGDVSGWLNSDDVLLPGALHAIGEAFRDDLEAVLIYGAGRKIDVDDRTVKRVPARPFDAKLLRSAFTILQPAMYFRRDVYLRMGGMDESLHYAMDWELVLRLAHTGPIRAIPTEIAALRCYPDTKTASGGWARFAELAEIGRRTNGVFDRNFIACHVRRLVRRTGSQFARRVADHLLAAVYPAGSVMVTGWPDAE